MTQISDYNVLVTAIQKWCARSDTTFTGQIETFVNFAELRMNNGQGDPGDPLYCDPLSAPEMETLATVTITNGSGTMPTDASTVRTITRDGDQAGLTYVSPRQYHTIIQAPSSTGLPNVYTIDQGLIKLDENYSGTINVGYYKVFTPLGPTNLTNTILAKYPLLYLSGSLFEAFSFLQETDLAMGHYARYRSQVAGINTSANSVRFGGSGAPRIRPRQSFA